MDARNQIVEDTELREEEDLNVSNLLVTKSERAASTESNPPLTVQRSTSEVIKVAMVGALGSVAVAAMVVLARWLLSEPRRRSPE
jgi:hypothetical protein